MLDLCVVENLLFYELSGERLAAIHYLKEVEKMTALAVLGGIVGVALLMAVCSILDGYALSVLWGWFVVPTFGAPPLGLVPAIGIAMVVSYMTHQIHDCKKEDRSVGEEIARNTAFAIGKPSLMLFFGWIVHLFM